MQGTACTGKVALLPAFPPMLLKSGASDASLQMGPEALRTEARERGWVPMPTAALPAERKLAQQLQELAAASRKRQRADPLGEEEGPRKRAAEGRGVGLPGGGGLLEVPVWNGAVGAEARGAARPVPGPLARFGFARRAAPAPD